jgi:hypothetical protein
MNTSKLYRFLIVSLFLLAATCDPKVKFESPQPNGRKDLSSIPSNFHGEYLELADSLNLTIDSKLIVQEELRIARLTKQQLWEEIDTVFEFDTILNIVDNTTVAFDFYDDSVQLTTHTVDTLFDLADNGILREYKGFLFLNTPLENDLWKVKVVKIKGDSLMLSSLVTESEIESIRPITQVIAIADTLEHKTKEYRLNPKKSEMKKILTRKKLEFGYIRD